jgi:hypothetical protein
MKKHGTLLAIATLSLLTGSEVAAQQHLMVPNAHYAMSQEPPIAMRAEGYDSDHEILVALPATYGALPDKKYPVLWIFAENPLLRQYPSIELQTRVYRDRDHCTVVPIILGDGLKFVFAEEAAKLEKQRW